MLQIPHHKECGQKKEKRGGKKRGLVALEKVSSSHSNYSLARGGRHVFHHTYPEKLSTAVRNSTKSPKLTDFCVPEGYLPRSRDSCLNRFGRTAFYNGPFGSRVLNSFRHFGSNRLLDDLLVVIRLEPIPSISLAVVI